MLLQILGVVLVLALVFTLFVRPGATLAVILAVGVVGAAIVVSWNDIQQTRAQQAARAAFVQQSASALVQPNVTVPPPTPAHSGT